MDHRRQRAARGWPSAASSRSMRSSDRSMRLGCSASRRASVASIGATAFSVRCEIVRRPRREPHAGVGRRRRQAWTRRQRRRLGQQAAETGKRRAQIVAMHHHVDHAVLLQIFGALEAFRQLLADGLLDHARAGEADQRAGLGDMHVAEHGVGRGHAAGGRIGQHDDVGQASLRAASAPRPSCAAICISDRMPSCMRAPPEAANMMKGVSRFDRGLQAA